MEQLNLEELVLRLRNGKPCKMNPVLRCLVQGMCDRWCVLSKLRGTPHIMQNIWRNVQNYWRDSIRSFSGVEEKTQGGGGDPRADLNFLITTREIGMYFKHRCWAAKSKSVSHPCISSEGQTNSIFCFEFSTPSLCVPSSGYKNTTKLY